MATAVIRIKRTVTTPDDVTTYATTNYWWQGGIPSESVIVGDEEATIDAADLQMHLDTGLIEEVVS